MKKKGHRNASHKRNSVLRLIRENKAQFPALLLCAVLSLLAGVFKTQSAMAWGSAVDYGIAGSVSLVYYSLMIMLLFVVLDGLRTGIMYIILGRTSETVVFSTKMRAYHVLAHGDVSILQQKAKSGDTAVRINSDISNLGRNLSSIYPDFIRRTFMGILSLFMGMFLSWELSLVYLVILLLSFYLFDRISAPVQQQRKRSADATGRASSHIVDVLSDLPTIKSFGLQKEMESRFETFAKETLAQSVKTARISANLAVVRQVSSIIQFMSLFLVGALLLRAGRITPGEIIAFSTMSSYIRDAFSQLDRFLTSIRQSFALGDRIYELLDIPIEQDGKGALPDSSSEFVAALSHVSFRYGEVQVLRDVSISVKKGQKVGIIGSSGCGKSTIIKLLCGFYRPTAGRITIFGSDVREIPLDALRENIALIAQDAGLFYGTVRENVQYGDLDADESALLQAIDHAAIGLSGLADGINTQVGESGAQISGGQKQRVAIARALLKNAPLLLLDEATSALDTKTESDIQHTLDEILVGRSAIIVAHRLSSVKRADYIYCIDAGRVVEEGTPHTLMDKRGYFYKMCQKQGFVGGKEYAD